jgi:hypothetical protein
MKWITRQYSKTRIDRAGGTLLEDSVREDEINTALEIVNNWRSSHAFPLNTMQIWLRRLARQVDSHPLVAQRIKRLSSIELKLRRFPTMTLSQMQDLGGCRAIVAGAAAVLRFCGAGGWAASRSVKPSTRAPATGSEKHQTRCQAHRSSSRMLRTPFQTPDRDAHR